MNQTQLISFIERLVDDSELTTNSSFRDKARDYYFGEPFGNERKGNSQVVMKELQDTIEWMMPQLIDVFYGSDEVVQFIPRNPQEMDDAADSTRFVNQVVTQDNEGFRIFNDWFRDALLYRNGVVRYRWDARARGEEVEIYNGLSQEEYNALVAEHEDLENVRIVFKQRQAQGNPVFDVTLYTGQGGQVVIENINPEQFRIDPNARSLAEARYVGIEYNATLSDLRQLGYTNFENVEFDDTDPTDNNRFTTRIEHTEADKQVLVKDLYVKIDFNGDGINELRHVVLSGQEIFENEEVSIVPYADITPQLVPHCFEGLSITDAVSDLQEIKSTIFRNVLDNMYLANHGRMLALEGQVNLRDLQSSRPNQIVRTKSIDAVRPLPHASLDSSTFNVLNYIDSTREARSGVNPNSGGLSSNLLNPQVTNDAINQAVTQAQRRIELIARTFAETGVKKLYQDVQRLLIENAEGEELFEYRGEWRTVSPSEWTPINRIKVNVGLGADSREAKVNRAQTLLQTVNEMSEDPDFQDRSITRENKYNAYINFLNANGVYDTQRFIAPPMSSQAEANAMLVEAQMQDSLRNELVRSELGLTQLNREAVDNQFNREAREFELQTKAELEVYKLKLREREINLQEKELEFRYNSDIQDEDIIPDTTSVEGETQELEQATDVANIKEQQQLNRARAATRAQATQGQPTNQEETGQ